MSLYRKTWSARKARIARMMAALKAIGGCPVEHRQRGESWRVGTVLTGSVDVCAKCLTTISMLADLKEAQEAQAVS